MDGVQTTAANPPSAGLLESLKLYLLTWVDLLKTRVEIVSTEIEEEKERLKEIILLGVGAFVCGAFGVLTLTGFVVVMFWEHRLWVLGSFALLYLGLGVWAGAVARSKLKSKPKLFAATLAELAKDRQHLSS